MLRHVPLLLCLSLALAACSRSEPYVHRPDEFNRENPSFGPGPKDILKVTICTSERGPPSQTVLEMAGAECAKFSKTAVFASQDYMSCPLLSPVATRFECVGARSDVPGDPEASSGWGNALEGWPYFGGPVQAPPPAPPRQ